MPKQPDNTFPCVFFHTDSVFVTNQNGNPYGPPIKINGDISKVAPFEVDLLCNGYLVQDHPFVTYVATSVWPNTTERPNTESSRSAMDLKLQEFTEQFGKNKPLSLTFHGLQSPKLKPSSASVWEIFDDEYGMIQVKILNEERFFSIFHREDIYLKDGKRAVDHIFFRDKPLKDIVSFVQILNYENFHFHCIFRFKLDNFAT